MYNATSVVDVHGHMSTPPQFRAFAYSLISLRSTHTRLRMPDDLMDTALVPHLRALDERRIDVQFISPRPIAMMHWERPYIVKKWTATTNDVIAQQCRMYPDRFVGVAQLPQSVEHDTANCVAELERCVHELGFVGAIVNPDPSAERRTPGLDDRYWHPLYEAAEGLGVALMIHPSISRDRRLEALPDGYQYNNLAEETLATLLLENSDVFARFPRLRIVVCHCGGALRRQLPPHVPPGADRPGPAGQTGMHVARTRPPAPDVSDNLFFDTCAYDPAFLEAAIRQRGAERLLFGTEAPGAGTHVRNPETGRPSDDLVPVIDGLEVLRPEDKALLFHDNALRVFPLAAGKPGLAASGDTGGDTGGDTTVEAATGPAMDRAT